MTDFPGFQPWFQCELVVLCLGLAVEGVAVERNLLIPELARPHCGLYPRAVQPVKPQPKMQVTGVVASPRAPDQLLTPG